MNFQERVQVYGTKDGIEHHIGSMTRNPFSVLLDALVEQAKGCGAEDDDDYTVRDCLEYPLKEFREHLHANHNLPELELDFEKAAQ